MAMSLLQDAQTRTLAVALAGIKREDLGMDRSLSLSPPMSANTSAASNSDHHSNNMYPGLQQAQAAASAFNMLAANRQAAAAFMAAQLPMSTMFSHHPALFGSWANAAAAAATMSPHMPLSSGPHSPPASPNSPLPTTPASSNLNGGGLGKHSLASLISPTSQTELHHHHNPHQQQHQQLLPTKKSRKQLSIKKDLMSTSTPTSPAIEISMSVADLYHHHTPAGPISPPSSGSSPNSTHEGHNIAAVTAATGTPKDPSRDKSFTCKICSRSFGYKHVLQNHERTHTGEKPFECPECHKRFTRDHHLKTHMRLHTGEKPYHCSHCDRQFVQVANLRRHLRVHTGERPYTCEICDGKFSDSNQLKSHMLVHNGEKPYECERCHAKFRRRHHLMNHKCGVMHSPPTLPTPAISPAMSGDFVSMMCDQKSAMGSSYGSEESMDLGGGKPTSSALISPIYEPHSLANEALEAPLDLSEDAAILDARSAAARKAHEIRRVFRLPPPQIHHIPMPEMPVQTEPEDLSMRSPHSCHEHASMVHHDSMLMHDDIDLDELDDAATLYMRQQQLAAMKRSICME